VGAVVVLRCRDHGDAGSAGADAGADQVLTNKYRGSEVQRCRCSAEVLRGCIGSAEVVQSRCSSCEVHVQAVGAGGSGAVAQVHRCRGAEFFSCRGAVMQSCRCSEVLREEGAVVQQSCCRADVVVEVQVHGLQMFCRDSAEVLSGCSGGAEVLRY